MRLRVQMRLENDQEDNTWYSGTLDDQPEIQLYMTRDLYVALGKQENLSLIIDTNETEV